MMTDKEYKEQERAKEKAMFDRIISELSYGFGFGSKQSAVAIMEVKKLAMYAASDK